MLNLLLDLKQTNFIERLVEDTLANDANPEGFNTFQVQSQHHQEEFSEDNNSQFSRLNESIEDRKTQESTTYGES